MYCEGYFVKMHAAHTHINIHIKSNYFLPLVNLLRSIIFLMSLSKRSFSFDKWQIVQSIVL